MEQRDRVMNDAHDLPSAGPLGVDKTYHWLESDVYWSGMYHDVVRYAKACRACQQNKVSQEGQVGFMG